MGVRVAPRQVLGRSPDRPGQGRELLVGQRNDSVPVVASAHDVEPEGLGHLPGGSEVVRVQPVPAGRGAGVEAVGIPLVNEAVVGLGVVGALGKGEDRRLDFRVLHLVGESLDGVAVEERAQPAAEEVIADPGGAGGPYGIPQVPVLLVDQERWCVVLARRVGDGPDHNEVVVDPGDHGGCEVLPVPSQHPHVPRDDRSCSHGIGVPPMIHRGP